MGFHHVPPLGDFATCAVTVTPLLVGYIAFCRHERALIALCSVATGVMLIAGYLTFSGGGWPGPRLVVVRALRQARRAPSRCAGRGSSGLRCVPGARRPRRAARDRTITFMGDRWWIYSAVLKKIPENPLTGTGYGHETDKPWYERARPGAEVYHAHNIALSYLDQMGRQASWRSLRSSRCPPLPFAAKRCARWPAGSRDLRPRLARGDLREEQCRSLLRQANLWLFAHLGIYLGQIEGASHSQALVTSTGMSATSRVSGQTISGPSGASCRAGFRGRQRSVLMCSAILRFAAVSAGMRPREREFVRRSEATLARMT